MEQAIEDLKEMLRAKDAVIEGLHANLKEARQQIADMTPSVVTERDDTDKEMIDWIERHRLSVSWMGHWNGYCVQKAGQVLGNIGKGSTAREAIRAAIQTEQESATP